MSALKDDRGHYAIDPAELHRAFPFQVLDRSVYRVPELQPTSLENHLTISVNRSLEREVELLREMLAKAEANADHWRALAERQQALLENKQHRKPHSFLFRLLGR